MPLNLTKFDNIQSGFDKLLQFLRNPIQTSMVITSDNNMWGPRITMLLKVPLGMSFNTFKVFYGESYGKQETCFTNIEELRTLGYFNLETDKLYNASKYDLLRILGSNIDALYDKYGQDVISEVRYETPGSENFGFLHCAVREIIADKAEKEFPYSPEAVAEAKKGRDKEKMSYAMRHEADGIYFRGQDMPKNAKDYFKKEHLTVFIDNVYTTDVAFDKLLTNGVPVIELIAEDVYRDQKDRIKEQLYRYYAVRSEFEQLDTTPGWHQAIRALSRGINEVAPKAENLRVEFDDHGTPVTVRMTQSSLGLQNFSESYGTTPADRATIWRLFPGSASHMPGQFTIQDIVRVLYGKKVVYERSKILDRVNNPDQ